MIINIYDDEFPNLSPLSDADGHIINAEGAIPLYRKERVPVDQRDEDELIIVHGVHYYPGGPK